jgi:stage II sporulation protein AA (anti-sigma F factor antagonist)
MLQQANHINMEQHGAVTLFDIHGDITHLSESILSEALRTGNRQEHPRILLKIDPDAYINSGGMALLIQFLAESRKNSQQVGITGASEHFKKIFRMVGITELADIYDNVDNAVEALSEAPCSHVAAW